MFQRHLFWMVAAVFTILLIFLIRPFAVSSDDTLFTPIAGKAPAGLTSIEAARRVRPVYINWNALRPHTEELRLNLFDNASLTATMRRVDSTVFPFAPLAGRRGSRICPTFWGVTGVRGDHNRSCGA